MLLAALVVGKIRLFVPDTNCIIILIFYFQIRFVLIKNKACRCLKRICLSIVVGMNALFVWWVFLSGWFDYVYESLCSVWFFEVGRWNQKSLWSVVVFSSVFQ